MTSNLRHSHIAIRETLPRLALAAHAQLSTGQDDFGTYRFFDIHVHGQGGEGQWIRFAAHAGDAMVHLLAERIDDLDDLVLALTVAGVSDHTELSISRETGGLPLRDVDLIRAKLKALADDSARLAPLSPRFKAVPGAERSSHALRFVVLKAAKGVSDGQETEKG